MAATLKGCVGIHWEDERVLGSGECTGRGTVGSESPLVPQHLPAQAWPWQGLCGYHMDDV